MMFALAGNPSKHIGGNPPEGLAFFRSNYVMAVLLSRLFMSRLDLWVSADGVSGKIKLTIVIMVKCRISITESFS